MSTGISGEVLPLLSDRDLKELGMAALGDRKSFKMVELVVDNSTQKISATCMQYRCVGGLKRKTVLLGCIYKCRQNTLLQ